jgi:glycosyltransferase involved in cell wall biosynthesis
MSKVLIAFPVYNEEEILEKNCLKVFDFCQKNLTDDFTLVIADNASTDKTREIGEKISQENAKIKYFHSDKKGKGIAIKSAWQKHPADYYIFMDMDLATDLSALPALINELKNGTDLAIGSRYLEESSLRRPAFRKIISRFYNSLIKIFFHCPFRDLAIGFKAVNKKVIEEILPLTKNKQWFFDNELVLLSFSKGLKIKEIPIKWSDPEKRHSKAGVFVISLEYLKEIIRLKF